MRILLLAHSFNSLSQRLYVDLRERGHQVSVELDINDTVSREAVALFEPHIVLAPFLKRPIPGAIWQGRPCLVVHPGIMGDRGPSALDWALLEGEREWGVTVLQAEAQMDAGPVWASGVFPMRAGTKSSLYRREVADAASAAVLRAIERLESGTCRPTPVRAGDPLVRGCERPVCRPADRRIDWTGDDTATVLRKIRSADGAPGVPDALFGRAVRLFDAHRANGLSGPPGAVLAHGGGALARATRDGAVWIGHVREHSADPGGARRTLKLPAEVVFAEECARLPEAGGYAPIHYVERGAVGLLEFEFYNGAMSTAQCQALRTAYARALARPIRVLVLAGGADYWSNGIHLGMIEAAESPAEESWHNINAMDDLTGDIATTTDRLVVAALRGGAGAGGVFLALAADEVWAVSGIVLNPHYKDMGNLYGSEYWTYLLPRRVDADRAAQLMQRRLPMGVHEARRLGLVDRVLPATTDGEALETILAWAHELAHGADFAARLAAKRRRRATDEHVKALEHYRSEELERMYRNFYGFDPSYHVARYNFIYKVPKSRTPLHLAPHRVQAMPRRRMLGGFGDGPDHEETAYV